MFYAKKRYDHGEFSCCFRNPLATHSHCSLLHGYAPAFTFIFGCRALDDKYWVQDFGGLKTLKEWLKEMFDHTVLIKQDDPHIRVFQSMHHLGIIALREVPQIGMEYFAQMAYHFADGLVFEASKGRVWVESVEAAEHSSNSAIYDRKTK